MSGELHPVHLRNKLVPCFLLLFLFVFLFGVLSFDVRFDAFSALSGLVAGLVNLFGRRGDCLLRLGSAIKESLTCGTAAVSIARLLVM
jgi:hypothetical protein